jgi:chromosomal replication initiation ATPase DnaA
MRKSNQQSIGIVIKRLLKNQKLEGRLKELDVLELSEELLGKNLMRYINDLSIKNGTLIIKVKSSAVRNELSYQKSEIIKKVNDQVGNKILQEIILK